MYSYVYIIYTHTHALISYGEQTLMDALVVPKEAELADAELEPPLVNPTPSP
jgi:hypothetical protein